MKRAGNRMTRGIIVVSVILITALLTVLTLLAIMAISGKIPEMIDRARKSAYPVEYEDIILEASKEFSVPPERICAVIYAESKFNKNAKSSAGAIGLMQIIPETFDDVQKYMDTSYSYEDLYDPRVNIFAGTCYLSYLYSLLGDWDETHAAYNAGIGNVWSWLENDEYSENGRLKHIPFEETKNYVKKVDKLQKKYAEIYFSDK